MKAVAESVLREVMGRTPIQPALGPMRAQIAGDVMDQSQQILNSYHAGVEITQVLLQKVDPAGGGDRKLPRRAARQHRCRTAAQRGAGLCERHRAARPRRRRPLVAAGQGEKQATIAQATGETKRFLSVLAAYRTAKDITLQRMYLDTMRDILTHSPTIIVDDKVKGLLPYLQLGGAGRRHAGGAPAQPAAPPATLHRPPRGPGQEPRNETRALIAGLAALIVAHRAERSIRVHRQPDRAGADHASSAVRCG